MRRPRVSAALIVRDEQRFLPGCLASLAGRVDEIVVADTGSTDDSIAIARAAGARVFPCAWTADFAAARNAAVDACGGDWILYIDADERVVDWDAAGLAAAHADPAAACATVRFKPLGAATRYREHRLFRNRPELRFRGSIHESLLPALEELRAREGARVAPVDTAIDHEGYDGDQSAKRERDLPLLRARLAVDPDHVYSLDHLGRTLAGLGDAAGAEDAWTRAIEVVRARGVREPADVLPFLHLADARIAAGASARALLDEARARFPGDHALAWLDARTRLDAGDAAGALPLFAALGGTDPDALCGDSAWDRSIFGALPSAAAGLCALKLGRDAEAAEHYARAAALAPGVDEYRVKAMYAAARARDRARR